MKSLKFLIVALLSIAAFASCNQEESASLSLSRTALYFTSWDDAPQTISYVATNATSVAVGTYSQGWSARVDEVSHTIIVEPIGTQEEGMTNDDLPKEGSVVVNALNSEGTATSYYIYVYIAETKSLDEDGRANCYIVTKPSVNYTFDVMHRPDGTELNTASVKLLWQSNYDVIKHTSKVGDNAQFYVLPWEGDESKVLDTNAVLAAYNSADEVIWSWHIWIVDEDPTLDNAVDTYANGKTFMRKNLGAFTNSNGVSADEGAENEQKILDSYGMYYQWGRKDPFPRPLYFDAAGAYDEDRYNEGSTYIKEVFAERTSSNGTIDYITKNPMHFITNAACVEEGGDGVGDWLATADNTLWSESSKSLYDPCPYGWRVPSVEDFAVLYLADDEDNTALDKARKQYGWHLSDGNKKYFYPACGRRRYNDGKVENMNYKEGVYPSQPQPWEGHYWTSSTSADGKAVSLYFDLTTTRTINKFNASYSDRKANGFQIRCVKE